MDIKSSVEELYKQAARGTISKTVLDFLKDYFVKRREQAERKICNCVPTIEQLLDTRAELKEVRRMEQELLHNIVMGISAEDDLTEYKKKEAEDG